MTIRFCSYAALGRGSIHIPGISIIGTANALGGVASIMNTRESIGSLAAPGRVQQLQDIMT